jgi:flagellar biosynthesis GTPase FlhF
MASSAPKSPAPGTYRFIVRSVNEALAVLKSQLGPEARVLSVRPVRQGFLKRIFGGAKLEVIAELAAPEPVMEPGIPPPVPGVLSSTYAAGLARGSRPVDLRSALKAAGFSETLLWRVET